MTSNAMLENIIKHQSTSFVISLDIPKPGKLGKKQNNSVVLMTRRKLSLATKFKTAETFNLIAMTDSK